MVAKKSELDKYVRVAFTMEPELHSSVIEKIKAEKATLSGVISALLSAWVSGAYPSIAKAEKSDQITNKPSFEDVLKRLSVLEDKVGSLIVTNEHQYDSVPIINPLTSQEDICKTVHVHEISHEGELLSVNSDMRNALRDRLKVMKDKGMSQEEICDRTGIPVGTQKKINSLNQPFKKIQRTRYEALMNLNTMCL
jgi:hypothetical protein